MTTSKYQYHNVNSHRTCSSIRTGGQQQQSTKEKTGANSPKLQRHQQKQNRSSRETKTAHHSRAAATKRVKWEQGQNGPYPAKTTSNPKNKSQQQDSRGEREEPHSSTPTKELQRQNDENTLRTAYLPKIPNNLPKQTERSKDIPFTVTWSVKLTIYKNI